MRIVLISPSGSVARALAQLQTSHDEIIVVSRSAPDAEITSIPIAPRWHRATQRLEKLLGGSALGRNLQRLSPLDAGLRFAAAARRNDALRACIQRTDLIVVLERDGILTGWRAAKNWAPAHARAVYGVAPAQAFVTDSA
ncbi:hypothetical protein [Microbacterium sp.]|uniref:hypothetical protein n=1 Tax=Microbacterium sp. TaxID=51671 RepID=UPI00260B73CB|nr:hypothetical protein [Microbacterium sp.]